MTVFITVTYENIPTTFKVITTKGRKSTKAELTDNKKQRSSIFT